MRRAIVLVLAFYPFLGTTSPAAEKPKPLKTKKDSPETCLTCPGAVVIPYQSAPLSDNMQAETCTLPTVGAECRPIMPPLKQHFEYILPGSCVAAIEKGKDFKCKGPDKDHLKCEGISLTVRGHIDECLEIHVEKDKQ